MARPHGIASKCLMELLDEFPNTPSLTLAKLAYKRHPELWPSVETARTKIRDFRGACGEKMRDKITVRKYFRPRRSPSTPVFSKAFTPKNPRDWNPVVFSGPARLLVLSDVHVPFFDPKAVNAAVQYGLDKRADTVLLNGDICDCFAADSKHEKDPRMRDFPGERAQTILFLEGIRQTFPKAKIIYKLGNHEERHISYMRVKAPELLGLECLEIGSLFDLERLKIELVDDRRPIRFGRLNIIHGHEYRFAITNPVNPARGLFLKAKCYCLAGHFHQSSHHTEKNVEQGMIATWSTGCLCEIHPEWLPMNNWVHGFAYVEVEKDGTFHVENKVYRNGKIY